MQLKAKFDELVEVYRQQERGPRSSLDQALPAEQQASAQQPAQQAQQPRGGLFARMRASGSMRRDG